MIQCLRCFAFLMLLGLVAFSLSGKEEGFGGWPKKLVLIFYASALLLSLLVLYLVGGI